MRILRFLPLLTAIAGATAVPGAAQTWRQTDITDRWRDPDARRPRGPELLRDVTLGMHNDERARLRLPALDWDDALARDAQGYARELARTDSFRHSSKESRPRPEGENLWMGTRGAYTYDEMMGTFLNERRYYVPHAFPDISTTRDWRDVGHYTQIVWRTTTSVGCALVSNEWRDFLVCRYSPPGNIWGRRADE